MPILGALNSGCINLCYMSRAKVGLEYNPEIDESNNG